MKFFESTDDSRRRRAAVFSLKPSMEEFAACRNSLGALRDLCSSGDSGCRGAFRLQYLFSVDELQAPSSASTKMTGRPNSVTSPASSATMGVQLNSGRSSSINSDLKEVGTARLKIAQGHIVAYPCAKSRPSSQSAHPRQSRAGILNGTSGHSKVCAFLVK